MFSNQHTGLLRVVGGSVFGYVLIGLFFLRSHSTHLVTKTSPKIGKLAMKRYGNIAR
jgi:hypothetical protein